ncbi:MAG: flagellin [Lachnospiraceae bacterium]|nr:flagellin [Lachnospiraceae bacterium]
MIPTSLRNGTIEPTTYCMNYIGNNNMYVVDQEVLTSGPSIAMGAKKLGTGDDMTEYLCKDENAQNKGLAVLNTSSYVAFINVELDSTVGNSIDATTGKDLATDGTSSTVRANRDLYIYNTANGTITHITAGTAMTPYLKDDNTIEDQYRLVDILDGPNGTSERVKKQVLDNNQFEWTDSYLEIDESIQRLYDADGLEVSGIALYKYFDENGNYTGGLYSTSQARAIDEVFATTLARGYQNIVNAGGTAVTIGKYITQSSQQVAEGLTFNLHVGAQSDRKNKISAVIETLTSAGIGIDKLASYNIGIVDETGNNATDAIDVIDEALQKISRQRSALGAVQNRLDHTIRNLDNIVENTTAAESAIRDTDMAEEMVRYANSNILQQAGQSMLAQANSANEGVLSLLQ